MALKRRLAISVALIAVAAVAAFWLAMSLRPDMTLIGGSMDVSRADSWTGPTGRAIVTLDFTRASDAYKKLNLGIDLNGDGRIAGYETSGGAVQQERVVADGDVRVAAGKQEWAFDINDPDALTRNNFKSVAVLTGKPLGDWSGGLPLGSAARTAIIASIAPAAQAASPSSPGAGGSQAARNRGESFSIKTGESALVQGGLRVTLISIGDSRCKKGVQCFWAGELSPKFRFETGTAGSASEELTLGTTTRQTADTFGFHVTLSGATAESATIIVK